MINVAMENFSSNYDDDRDDNANDDDGDDGDKVSCVVYLVCFSYIKSSLSIVWVSSIVGFQVFTSNLVVESCSFCNLLAF